MSHNFLPYDQDQLLLLSPSLSDWVEEESLARFVSDVVDELDARGELSAFYARYRSDGWGRAAYHPAMMVKVLLYCYCQGVRSSRKIARAVEDQVSLRYLSANQQPDFRTISDFRKDHLEAFEAVFVQVLALCGEAGLVQLGRVALDGRKVKANASLANNRTKATLAREVAEIMAEAERIDAEEDDLYGTDQRGDELPEALRDPTTRGARLQAALDRLERDEAAAQADQAAKIRAREAEERRTGKKKRGRKPRPPEEVVHPDAKANTTDPDSRIVKSPRGYLQGYNAQAMAACDSQVIVAADVTHQENDVQQLAPMLDRCREQAGARPAQCLADAGYWSESNAGLEDETTELFVATTKTWKHRRALREQPPPRGRIPKDLPPKARMERKLRTQRGQRVYRDRSSTIEPVFGQMEGRGLNHFLLRGLDKVRGEWSMFCTTHNLLKLWRSGWQPATAGGPTLR